MRGPGRSRTEAAVITLNHYLVLSAILFAIGTAGVFLRRNVITVLLSIEIMLNAVNLTFVAFGRALGSASGQVIVFFVMTVAAAEAAVGLAIVIGLVLVIVSDVEAGPLIKTVPLAGTPSLPRASVL